MKKQNSSDPGSNIIDVTRTGESASRSRDDVVIDYDIFSELYPDQTIGLGNIDNVYDELFSSTVGPRGSRMIFEFRGGRAEETSSALLFYPTRQEITVLDSNGVNEKKISLESLNCLRMASMPDNFPDLSGKSQLETLNTHDGMFYKAIVPDGQRIELGLFAFSAEDNDQCKYLFFPYCNIKMRSQKRMLGEILIEKGVIQPTALANALNEYKRLKMKKLGEIIAEIASIHYSRIERIMQQAYKLNLKGVKAGQILVKAGLVNVKQVEQALIVQKQFKTQKIGHYLIKKGLADENSVYSALAEKFRMDFVDLRRKPISRESLKWLPRDLVMKLQVLPITLQERDLEVATMVPDVPAVRDMIAKHAGDYLLKMVVARPSQIKAAIRQLYQV
ncbi:hypothetical protein ACFL6N_04770 [Thermodesulfobacteriota bacterium]